MGCRVFATRLRGIHAAFSFGTADIVIFTSYLSDNISDKTCINFSMSNMIYPPSKYRILFSSYIRIRATKAEPTETKPNIMA